MDATSAVLVCLVGIGATIGFMVIVALSALLRGYVLSVLWGWFMVPVLGLPPIAVAHAIGIALVASLLTHQTNDCATKKESGAAKLATAIVNGVVAPLLMLAMKHGRLRLFA